MFATSTLVHDATVALRDAADAAIALGSVASAFSEVLKCVAELEARVEALEHAAVPFGGEDPVGRGGAGLRASMGAETCSHVDTNTAAKLLGRTSQTLRKWACYENGPLRPVRVNGRLAWPLADIRRLLNHG